MRELDKIVSDYAYDALSQAEKELLFLERIILKLFNEESKENLNQEELDRVFEIMLIPRESRENECSLQKDGRKFTDTFPIFSTLKENWKKFVNRK